MKSNKTLLTTLLSMGLLASAGATQAAGWCESGKPVKFAGLNWESGMLLTDVLQVVLEKVTTARPTACRATPSPWRTP